jgi:hypothetical protein
LPASVLQHVDATAIRLVLANGPVKLVASCLSPTRPLVESYLTECLSGGFPGLMASDPNAKHPDWYSGLTTNMGTLLRGYANRNTCLMYAPDSPTMAPYQPSAIPDVLDTVVVKDLSNQCILLHALHSARITSILINIRKPSEPPRHQANVPGHFLGLP